MCSKGIQRRDEAYKVSSIPTESRLKFENSLTAHKPNTKNRETDMRILIAEDDQVLADGLLRSLRSAGAAVDHVASGSEADAALMTNNEFDLLILDLGLPKMHGLEVLKKLRARGSTLPVLILTAADSVEERVKGLDYGADDYMAKPFSLQELEARVRALTRRGMGGATSQIKHGPLNLAVLQPSTARWLSCLPES
jgi:DNA-binding response OmpR family regulator